MARGGLLGEFQDAHAEAVQRYFARPNIEGALAAEIPGKLAEAMRQRLLAPGQRIRPRVLLACAQMVSLKKDAALSSAVALEAIHAKSIELKPLADFSPLSPLSQDALTSFAIEVFLEAEAHVEPPALIAGLRRLIRAAGPRGAIGGQAEEFVLDAESSLDDLRQVYLKKTGALFSAALLIPKDLVGIPDDSSQSLALDIFSQELGLAFQTLEDLLNTDPKETVVSPSHILHYISLKEAKSTTLQRLNSASLSLTSAWSAPAQPLVQIAEDIARQLEGIGSD